MENYELFGVIFLSIFIIFQMVAFGTMFYFMFGKMH